LKLGIYLNSIQYVHIPSYLEKAPSPLKEPIGIYNLAKH